VASGLPDKSSTSLTTKHDHTSAQGHPAENHQTPGKEITVSKRLKRGWLLILLSGFVVTSILEGIVHEGRREIADWFREMGASTRDGLHDLEVTAFADEMRLKLDQLERDLSEGKPASIFLFTDAFGAVMAQNWRKTLIYKVFVVVGIGLFVGAYALLGLWQRKRPWVIGRENIILTLPLFIPFLLSLLASILKLVMLMLGTVLVFTAWLIPYVVLISLLWLSHEFFHRARSAIYATH
jgi:hypothetical protein